MTWINVLYFALGALAVCAVAMHRLHAYRMRVAAAMAELREWQTIQNVRNDTETRAQESIIRPIVETPAQRGTREMIEALDRHHRGELMSAFDLEQPGVYGLSPVVQAIADEHQRVMMQRLMGDWNLRQMAPTNAPVVRDDTNEGIES